jgi:hypothetical protein
MVKVKVKVNFSLEQVTKARGGGIALHILYLGTGWGDQGHAPAFLAPEKSRYP